MLGEEKLVKALINSAIRCISLGNKSKSLSVVQAAYDDRKWLDSILPFHYLHNLKNNHYRKCVPIFSFLKVCQIYRLDPAEIRAKIDKTHSLPSQTDIIRHWQELTN